MLSFFKRPKANDGGAAPDPQAAGAPAAPAAPATESARRGIGARLKAGLARTRAQLGHRIAGLFRAHATIDEALYDELETLLLSADVGLPATNFLLESLRQQVARHALRDPERLESALRETLTGLLAPLERPAETGNARPRVIMMVGVNGSGKTTTIGKLAKRFQASHQSVLLAAGDTFRAAAREQLKVWGERNNVAVIAQEGGDSAAVIFDAINAAKARGTDIVLADTAGRLPTQLHLMEELKKVKRVIGKALPGAPHDIWLVLDAGTGQNALAQVKAFDDALSLTGLVVTKLDGTAKGGVIAGIARERPVPVAFIGIGEQIDDLRPFAAQDFVEALFADD